jgi:hypothetical protein
MMVPGIYLQRVCIDLRNDGAWYLFAKGAYRLEMMVPGIAKGAY